jgi:hypothetical protein
MQRNAATENIKRYQTIWKILAWFEAITFLRSLMTFIKDIRCSVTTPIISSFVKYALRFTDCTDTKQLTLPSLVPVRGANSFLTQIHVDP